MSYAAARPKPLETITSRLYDDDNRNSPDKNVVKLNLNIRNYARLFAGIPDAVKQIVKDQKDVVLGGGAIRSALEGIPANDYDIFFISDENVVSGVHYIISDNVLDTNASVKLMGVPARMDSLCKKLQKRGFKVAFACPAYEIITLVAGNVKVQLINRVPYYSIDQLLKSFDFSICQFVTSDFGTLWTTRRAVRDVKKRWLSVVSVAFPAATLNRLHKYRNYGYYANERTMAELCWWIWDCMSSWEVPDSDDFYDRFNSMMRFYVD